MDTIDLDSDSNKILKENIYLPKFFSLDIYWKNLMRKFNKDLRKRWKQNSWSQDYPILLKLVKEIKDSNQKTLEIKNTSKKKSKNEASK